MLTVRKILAGRGAVDYYLNQTRRGLADYYLPADRADERDGAARLSAPGSSWWGAGAEALDLSGAVGRGEFVPLYSKAVRPRGGTLGRRFRLPEEAASAKADALLAAAEITDPYERWMAKHEVRRRGGHASVAAWDCTFSPPKSVSLLWAAGDRHVQQQVWAAHLAAVDAGLNYLQEHAAYVRAGRNGVRVLDTSGLVVARMNEWTSRDGDMHLHSHCLMLNRTGLKPPSAKPTLSIDRQLVVRKGESPYLGPPKRKASRRDVPVPRGLAEALAEHLTAFPPVARETVCRDEAGRTWTEVTELVFTTARGEPLTRSRFGEAWRDAVKEAGLPAGTSYHDLRHFYASLLIDHGESVKVVQRRLGHASATETLDTYSHLWPDSEDRTRDAVDTVLGASREPGVSQAASP